MGELAEKQIIPATAEEARSIGSPIYFTGIPCPQGHIANRYTSSYSCSACQNGESAKKRNKVWYKENGHKRNAKKRANRPMIRDRLAKQQKQWRIDNPSRHLFIQAKSRAKQNGLEFDISVDDIVIPDVCPVLGIKMKFDPNNRNISPSIDRIDNAKGYIKGNVQVISLRANVIKRDASLEELERIVKYMRKHKQQ